MEQASWWKDKSLRVIQTNLQVRDTPRMSPAKIAQDILDMGGNVLVTNVGGIYAWYPTEVEGHYVNRYLPKDYDLLKALIDECHARGIKLVARFDFSKTDDSNYQKHPRWFRRLPDGRPKIIAAERPGEEWPLLMETCINAPYRNEAVAMPVLQEVLTRYDIDGIFYNAPHGAPCCCDYCKKKYQEMYGKPLPTNPELFDPELMHKAYMSGNPVPGYEPGWLSRCLKDNMDKLYGLVKSLRPDIPMILYYGIYSDNLYERISTCDMLCTEPQDVLSLGWKDIPQFWKPALSVRLGRSEPSMPKPFGIIHSCPGMDWRHTGLPPAEYMFWMSQIPANGGMIWHSITGFNDTITDKRILDCVSLMNHQIMDVEPYMADAVSMAQTALMWNMAPTAEGWAEALINRQIQFDVLLEEQAVKWMDRYKLIIVPAGFKLTDRFQEALLRYVENGGNVLLEGRPEQARGELFNMLGIEDSLYDSEYMRASYLRFEGERLSDGFERTPVIAHRGVVQYAERKPGCEMLASFVPPFSPMEGVGAPPERASIMNPQTDIPLVTLNRYGRGQAMYVAFSFSALVKEFRLAEFYKLAENIVYTLLGGALNVQCSHINGLQMICYQTEGKALVHLVNGVGQRPLANNVPLYGLEVKVKLPQGAQSAVCHCAISKKQLEVSAQGEWAVAKLDRLDVWDMLVFEWR